MEPVIGVAFIVLGLLGLRLVDDLTFWNRWIDWNARSIPVGTLTHGGGSVRQKNSEGNVWRDMGAKEAIPVAAGDVVLTDASGGATLKVDGAAEVQIHASSLIVVETKGSAHRGTRMELLRQFFLNEPTTSALDVSKGRVSVKLTPKDQPLEVRIKNRLYRLTGVKEGTVEVSSEGVTTDGQGEVMVEEIEPAIGKARLNAPTAIHAGETLSLTGESIPAISKTTAAFSMSPAEGINWVGKNDDPVKFKWKWNPKTEKAIGTGGNRKLLIRKAFDTETEPKEVALAEGQTEYAAGLESGEYEWKLVRNAATKGAGVQTGWQALRVTRLQAPRVIGPANNAAVSETFDVTWEPLAPGLVAEVEFSSTGGKAAAPIPGGRAGLEAKLSGGDYTYRVRAKTEDGQYSDWTNTRTISINAPKAAPEPVAPPPVPTAPTLAKAPALHLLHLQPKDKRSSFFLHLRAQRLPPPHA